MIPTILAKVRKSKHSKLLFKLYIAWSICADLTLIGGIIWGLIYVL
jgi:hypothetical protein|tara:strand:- start:69 stop:206 length:138 start_codon:yes stop_codon:yes gene_type:complete